MERWPAKRVQCLQAAVTGDVRKAPGQQCLQGVDSGTRDVRNTQSSVPTRTLSPRRPAGNECELEGGDLRVSVLVLARGGGQALEPRTVLRAASV